MYKCSTCGNENEIVNQCGCDPNNLPTSLRRGFGELICPCCGSEVGIAVALDMITAANSFHCSECDETFGHERIRKFMAQWKRVLNWLDTAPLI